MTGYRELPAPPPWRALVECSWRAVSPDAPVRGGPHLQRVLPDGCMDLLWHEGRLLVAGPDTRAFLAAHPPATTVFGVRFRPGAAPALLGVPAEALRDLRVPLGDLHPPLARRTAARIEYGEDPEAELLDAVAALRSTRAEPDAGLRLVVRWLGAGAGVRAVADELGCTPRSLHRRCRAGFGYGPAMLRRILRFRAAVALAREGVPTATTAARAGYADQPHLSREVRALAGVPLGLLLSAPQPDGANRSTPLPSGSCTTA